MICKNVKQMLTISLRNAIPMHSQGYTCVPVSRFPHTFQVNKSERDADGNAIGYDVNTALNMCNCQFWQENCPHFAPGETTCKHIEFARAEETEFARIDALVEQADARELEAFDALNLLTEARADRGFFDYTGHTPCHLIAAPTVDAATRENFVHAIEQERTSGNDVRGIATTYGATPEAVEAYFQASNRVTVEILASPIV